MTDTKVKDKGAMGTTDDAIKMMEKQKQQWTARMQNLVESSLLSRKALIDKFIDPRRDYDHECGYPPDITASMYWDTYKRLGLGRRVVEVWPEASWSQDPMIYETEDADETEFEKAWALLDKQLNLLHFLHKIDEVSGIGRFGILLLGFGDGLSLEQPIAEIIPTDPKQRTMRSPPRTQALNFLRAFHENVVTVDTREADIKSPRFGQPTLYSVIFTDDIGGSGSSPSSQMQTKKVHWTRVIHIAEHRLDSEVYGIPRMEPVFNRLMDAKKVMGGAGEMFWKGGFPGYAYELQPGVGEADVDLASMKDQVEDYMNGLQRYLALVGVSVKSLSPQVADPTPHYEAILQDISITLGIPKRIFMGSERGELASSQDATSFNTRVTRRRMKYVTPMVIRPFVDRLIDVGVLPQVGVDGHDYTVWWPDVNAPTDADKAKIAETKTKAFAQYVGGSVDQLIPPAEYLTIVHGMPQDEVDQIMEAANEYQDTKLEQDIERQQERIDAGVMPGPGEAPTDEDSNPVKDEETTDADEE